MHARCASVNMCVFPKQLRDFVSGTWEPMAAVCSYFNVIVMPCILLSSRVCLISATLLYSVYRRHTGVVIRESVPVCVCVCVNTHLCIVYNICKSWPFINVYVAVDFFISLVAVHQQTRRVLAELGFLFSDGDGFCTRIRPILIVHNIQ